MKLNQWINLNNQYFSNLKNEYPIYLNYVEVRYQNYELKYNENVFNYLFASFILENKKELTKFESLKDLNMLPDKLGTFTNTNENANNKFSGENSVNYVGLSVEGTFNKNETSTNSNLTNAKNSSTVNLLSELIKLNDLDFINQFNKLNFEFEKLLITIVPFDI